MFQRLVIHVINQLKPLHAKWYKHPSSDSSEDVDDDEDDDIDVNVNIPIGSKSCVTRFIRRMLSILEHDSHPHCKYLSEYFGLMLDFARMGDSESTFLLQIDAVSVMITFFMSHKQQENYVSV